MTSDCRSCARAARADERVIQYRFTGGGRVDLHGASTAAGLKVDRMSRGKPGGGLLAVDFHFIIRRCFRSDAGGSDSSFHFSALFYAARRTAY